MKFKRYTGDLMGIYYNENHLVYKWDDESCKILFSVCRQGNAASCNFASDKKGLRQLRVAINEFIAFIFKQFGWCEMIFAEVKLRSVKKLVEKFGFVFLTMINEHEVYYLKKEKYYG